MDSLYEFEKNFSGLIDTWLSSSPVPMALTVNKPDEVTFHEREWSKKDTFVIMGADAAWGDTLQAWCGFVCFRNAFPAVQYVAEWLTYTQDARIVTDAPSQLGTEEGGFRENRHDQTVCSLRRRSTTSRCTTSLQHLCSTITFSARTDATFL